MNLCGTELVTVQINSRWGGVMKRHFLILLLYMIIGATGGSFGPPVFFEEHWRAKSIASDTQRGISVCDIDSKRMVRRSSRCLSGWINLAVW